MACPDELTLDLWRADALPAHEAAAVTDHIHTCTICAAAEQAAQVLSAEFHAALALDAEELAYVSGLKLAASWRASPYGVGVSWGWIALAGVIAGFAAWSVAAPMFGSAVAEAILVGVGTLLLNAAVVVVFGLGQALLEVIRNPALGLSQPLLALLALALLVWPRHFIPHRSTHA
jgi:anti-sigma factor RsiW